MLTHREGSILRARDPCDRWSPTELVDLGAASTAPLPTPQTCSFKFGGEETSRELPPELFDSCLISLGRNKNTKSCSLKHHLSLPCLQITLGRGMGCACGPSVAPEATVLSPVWDMFIRNYAPAQKSYLYITEPENTGSAESLRAMHKPDYEAPATGMN